MDSESDSRFFWGNRIHENPHQFLKDVTRTFILNGVQSEEHKLELFYCHLAPGGIAEQWYEDLRETELDTWAQLVDAFKIRWPKPSYTLSMADAIAIMREQKIITIDELGKYIELHHRPISTHAYWARDIYFLAQRLDVHDAIASEIRDKLPRPLRGFVDPDVETWADFRDQMEKVLMRALRETLADFKEKEEQGRQMEDTIRNAEAVQQQTHDMMMRLPMLQQPPVQQQILNAQGAFPPPQAQMTLWPAPVMRRFRLVPASPQGKDFSVPYMKLLYTLFPAASEFTIIPQPLPEAKAQADLLEYLVTYGDIIVLLLQVRAPGSVEPSPTREEADNQIRKRIHDLSSHCPLPVFHAVSAFGTRLCFYRGQAISPLRMQPPPHPESAMLDVMDEQGASVLKTIITEIKAACRGL